MKILELVSENFKRLSVVQITPDGNLIQICGDNGEGKSSVLDSIAAALGGKDLIPEQPIRSGKKTANIKVKLGDGTDVKFVVTRTFTPKDSYLTITAADGARYNTPQKILDGLMGAIGFDPLAFMRMDAKQQFELLRKIVKIEVDIDALDKRRADAFEARTLLHRDIKGATARRDAIVLPDNLPDEAPNLDHIATKMEQASFQNNERAALHRRRADAVGRTRATAEMVERLEADLAAARKDLVDAEAAEREVCSIEMIPEIDISAVRGEFETARRIVQLCEKRDARIQEDARVTTLTREAQETTAVIDEIDKLKKEALASAKMPVEGLSFEGGTVTFKGLPISQASGAEQLRVSAAIGAALNPKLRVLLARNGNDLDSKSLKVLAEFAEANDLQIFLERINEGAATGIIMEDGHVRGQEALVEAHEKAEEAKPAEEAPTQPATGEPPSDERQTKAKAFLAASLKKLGEFSDAGECDKLNAEVKVKLKNFPAMISGEWNGAYLERVRAVAKFRTGKKEAV